MKNLYLLLACMLGFTELNAQIVNIPDANFKAMLLESGKTKMGIARAVFGGAFYDDFIIDSNNNGEIEISEIEYIENLYIDYSKISDLKGIEYFVNLRDLTCSFNNLTYLDLSNLEKLEGIGCNDNQITSLKLHKKGHLSFCDFSNNKLTSFDATGYTLDGRLNFTNNLLESIFLKNGVFDSLLVFDVDLNLTNNPNLRLICVDDVDVESYKNLANSFNLTNCEVNSYCAFDKTLYGHYVSGQIKWCNDGSIVDGNSFKINVKSTDLPFKTYADIYSGASGYWLAGRSNGVYELKVITENDYYKITPETTIVNFETETSPVIRDFCITPNGNHPDLEVEFLPAGIPARPGFSSDYKILYKNKGNQIQSGTVQLNYKDAVLDYESSTPLYTENINQNITWNFADLKPFETRVINVTFKVNSPLQTPAVNDGDILNYTATIASNLTDETPTDNTFTLNQTVVNSHDPNDKICLEGAAITPNMVGDYLTYQIRFENTGTYFAENIVVKDEIDANVFDISTLVPLNSSHNFTTRINGNVAEFIFEGIKLPFEDATNDGYVVFKIKTKPTLALNSTVSNGASIYFDYNAPIITNTYTTTVKENIGLGTSDFEFTSQFALYPNPVKETLNIQAKTNNTINSVEIYNLNGQVVTAFTNAISKLDVSSLAKGTYLLKANTNQGVTTTKFVKE